MSECQVTGLLADCKATALRRFDEGAVVSPVLVLTVVDVAERQHALLSELLAELRDMPDYGVTGEFLATLAGLYEWRLREVSGE